MKISMMNSYLTTLCFTVFLLLCAICVAKADVMSCDSCGRECSNACGTKHFRTCCFNYLRKRSGPPIETDLSPTTNMLQNTPDVLLALDRKLETWIRDTRDLENSIHQRIAANRASSSSTMKKRHGASDEFLEFL